MRIRVRKLSNDRHELTIVREGDVSESVELETRSVLLHDFLHYAVEGEAKLEGGFWGTLARGKTLAEMNARNGGAALDAPQLAEIERIVGVFHGATHGQPPEALADGLRRYAKAREEGLPAWIDDELVVRVVERLRRLRGEWNATPFGTAMELDWPLR